MATAVLPSATQISKPPLLRTDMRRGSNQDVQRVSPTLTPPFIILKLRILRFLCSFVGQSHALGSIPTVQEPARAREAGDCDLPKFLCR